MLLLFISLFISLFGIAPSTIPEPPCKAQLYSVQQFGAIFGNMGNHYLFDMSAGVSYNKKFRLGCGVSFNPYGIRSMPAYSEMRIDIGSVKTAATVFGKGGFNLFPNPSDVNVWNPEVIIKRYTGSFAEGGIGFKTRLSNTLYYNTSFSYIYKKSSYMREGQMRWENGMWVQAEPETITAENTMFAMKIGLEF